MIVELERINDANREVAIRQLLDSFAAMGRGSRAIYCHGLAIAPEQFEATISTMNNEQLSLLYYDVEDNDDLAGAPMSKGEATEDSFGLIWPTRPQSEPGTR
ncbi:MAG: hypothetical protein K2X44_08755 [Magnetospirillum sp.]|nr:hypothetical protein [Magnetospirillum sp.]